MSFLRWPLAILTGALAGWLAARSQPAAAPPPAGPPGAEALLSTRLRQAAADSPARPGAQPPTGSAILQRVDGELTAAQAMVERIAASGPDALPALFREIRALPHDTLERALAESAFWQRCVETDPEAAAAWLGKEPTDSMRTLGAAWLRKDRAAALAWLQEQSFDPSVVVGMVNETLPSLSAPELADLLAAAIQPDSVLRKAELNAALYELANKDPAQAQRLFEGLPADHPHRGKLAKTIAQNLAAGDFDTAKAWVDRLPPGPDKEVALHAALSQAVFREPERVRQEIDSGAVPESRKLYLQQSVAAALVSRDPAAAHAYLKTLPDASISDARFSLAAADLPIATLHALQAEMARAGIAPTFDWTGRDAVADLKAAAALPEGPATEQFLVVLEESLLRQGNAAPADIAALPAASRSRLALQGLELARQSGDAAAARAWAEAVPDPGDFGVIQLAAEIARSEDPALRGVGTGLLERMPTEARGALVEFQARQHYRGGGAAAARDYVLALPAAEQAPALQNLMEEALQEGDTAVLGWAGQLPAGPAGDAYAGSLAAHYAGTDPAAALAWTRSIADPAVRQAALTRLAGTVLRDDYHSGLQFLDGAALSPEEQAVVQQQKGTITP